MLLWSLVIALPLYTAFCGLMLAAGWLVEKLYPEDDA